MNRNSLRSRPQPSAPFATAPAASSTAPRLANTSIRVPSAVWQSACAAAMALARRERRSNSRVWAAAISAGFGATRSRPSSPSRMTSAPSSIESTRGPSATTAGTFIAAARMATCEVGPPRLIARPATRLGSSSISCEGRMSSASMMALSGRAIGRAVSPESRSSTWRFRSLRSAARSIIRASPAARSMST